MPSDRVDPTLSDAAAALADVAGAAAAGAAAAGSNPRRRWAGEREMREGEADRARARRFEGAASAPHIWRPGVSPRNIRCVIHATAALGFFYIYPLLYRFRARSPLQTALSVHIWISEGMSLCLSLFVGWGSGCVICVF